jgi:hypothetical protein
MSSLVKTLLRWYLPVRADVEAVAALDRGDKGAAAACPACQRKLHHRCSYRPHLLIGEEFC